MAELTSGEVENLRDDISATISDHLPRWRYGRERSVAMDIIMEVLRASGCLENVSADPVMPIWWDYGDTYVYRFEYSSSSYAIGAGPKTLIGFSPDRGRWFGAFQAWCKERRRWVNHKIPDTLIRACLLKCIEGEFPSSLDGIAALAEEWTRAEDSR